ncbi:cobalamin biosynthesis protein [Pseudoalteromonas mariniglutinosa]|uniref:cobalamin biosynthesis protein CobD/CbiB n=1 Tax=Pseudoalteromonas mariniglutinosa TaxID=206042 RepID=UPI00384DEE4E
MLENIVQTHLDFIVFILALFAERFIPLVSWYHPNTFFSAVFLAIAERVYQPTDSKHYQYLASILAFSLVIIIIITLTVLFLEFAFYPELLAGLILYLSLNSRLLDKKARRIARLLKLRQKAAAREMLASFVIRDVTSLSSVGICKALMEGLILRTAREYFVVIFWYLIAGPIATLGYKLLSLMHQAWRRKMRPDSAFLKPIATLLFIIEWLPVRLLALTVAASKASKQSIHYIKHYGRHFYQTNTGWLLSVCSASIGVQLGGPAVYHSQRFNKMRIGTDRLPNADDLPILINRLNQAKAFWLLLILFSEIIKSLL